MRECRCTEGKVRLAGSLPSWRGRATEDGKKRGRLVRVSLRSGTDLRTRRGNESGRLRLGLKEGISAPLEELTRAT